MQESAIQRVATSRNDVIDQWYSEKMSGKSLSRPVMDELRQQAKQGFIKKLYFYRLDRLTRSGIADTLNLIKEFKDYGVELINIADGFELNGMVHEVIVSIMSWAAQNERIVINERISAARMRMEEQGIPWGRPRKEHDVEQMMALQKEGVSKSEIALRLNVPRTTVVRRLKEVA